MFPNELFSSGTTFCVFIHILPFSHASVLLYSMKAGKVLFLVSVITGSAYPLFLSVLHCVGTDSGYRLAVGQLSFVD